MFLNTNNTGLRLTPLVTWRTEKGTPSGVQYKTERFLRGCSHRSKLFRILYACARGSPQTECRLRNEHWLSTDRLSLKNHRQKCKQKSGQSKVLQIHVKRERNGNKVMLQPYDPPKCTSSNIMSINEVYHFPDLAPCIVVPYTHLTYTDASKSLILLRHAIKYSWRSDVRLVRIHPWVRLLSPK